MKPWLIAIDIQKGFLEPFWGNRNNPDFERRVANLLHAWRERGWPVVHVQHLSKNLNSPLHPSRAGVDFMDAARPIPGERIFQKHVNSAFIGTSLESILRLENAASLVFIGLTTDHCVSTSVRMASNLGFSSNVLSDATATFDRIGADGAAYPADQVHQISLASLHGEFAQVGDSETFTGTNPK
jgi:nicotinamidase-related amidase